MKRLIRSLTFLLCLVAWSGAFAQIPNAGFETWSLGTPTGWTSNNSSGVDTTIVRTTDAHSGTYAAQGIATTFSTVTFAPTLTALLPWTTASTTFSGYYKYSPVGGDTLFIAAVFAKNSKAIAAGVLKTTTAAASYTPFSIPMTYLAAGVPDSGGIDFAIVPASGSSSVHAGSTFKVDDLSFSGVTGVAQQPGTIPQVYSLGQNFPNPFNPSTTLRFSLPTRSRVRLAIYNVLGQGVAELVNGEQAAGWNEVVWNANVSSGLYFYRLEAVSVSDPGQRFVDVKKMILLK